MSTSGYGSYKRRDNIKDDDNSLTNDNIDVHDNIASIKDVICGLYKEK